jgi:hypothetical protein
VLVWVIVRYVLRDNLLAYPLTIGIFVLLQNASAMLQNHRPDLLANGMVTLGAILVLLLWAILPRPGESANA